jgi:glycosyltransferase involved in cell wall biosynthesis
MKTILFLIGSLQYGGAERVTANLANHFAESDNYRVIVRTFEFARAFPLSKKVDIATWPSGRKGTMSKISSVMETAVKLRDFTAKENVDVVLSFMEWANFVNLLSKSKGARHKAYVSVRCGLKDHYAKELNAVKRFFGWAVFKWLWKYADRTIVNSEHIKDDVRSLFGISEDKISVIHNPVDLKQIEERSKEDPGEDWFSKKEVPVVVNLASLTRPKAQSYLLKAFAIAAKIKQARLAVIGDGPIRGPLVAEAGRLGILDKILLMGWRDNPYKYLSRSDVFVLSSIYEGFPNAILEAMACGCPVVSFDCPSGPSEILSPQKKSAGLIFNAQNGLLVKERDVESLAKAIVFMLDNEEARDHYRAEGLKRIRDFDLIKIAEEYGRLF